MPRKNDEMTNRNVRENFMRVILILAYGLLTVATASAQTGGSGGSSSGATGTTGGSLGTSPAAPGTNSAGTALPGGGRGSMGSASTGTGDPKADKQNRRVDRKIKGICKGC
jgi:hypothetical protein